MVVVFGGLGGGAFVGVRSGGGVDGVAVRFECGGEVVEVGGVGSGERDGCRGCGDFVVDREHVAEPVAQTVVGACVRVAGGRVGSVIEGAAGDFDHVGA